MNDTISAKDWRSEPRKTDNERYSVPVFFRVTGDQKTALRQMARKRGETDAEFLRCLVDREARIQLKGETDAKLATSRKDTDMMITAMKGICRQLRRRSD